MKNKAYFIIIASVIVCRFFLLPALVGIFTSAKNPRPFTETQLRPYHYYALTGQDNGQQDLSKPAGFFNAWLLVDPKNGITSFPGGVDAAMGWPRKQYSTYWPAGWVNGGNDSVYYPGNREARIVFDFGVGKDANDTTQKVNITGEWGAQLLDGYSDTLWFYNLDTMFRHPLSQRWIYLARPDSVMVPFAYLVATGGGGNSLWRSTAVAQTCRYVMIRTVLKNQGSFLTSGDFSELVFYGTYNYDPTAVAKRPDVYAGPMPSLAGKTYGSFVGTNWGVGYDTLENAYDWYTRIYGQTNYWCASSSYASVNNTQYTFDHFTDIGPTQYGYFHRAKKPMWWTIRGQRTYLQNKLHGSLNIDSIYYDPESPYSYYYESRFYWNYAAKFGKVAWTTDSTNWTGDGSYPNGNGLIGIVEPGNEEDYWLSRLSNWCRWNAVYDGYEGRLGNRFGIKRADPSFKMMMPASIEIDTCAIACYKWFSEIMRTDGRLPFDYINFHHYPRTKNYLGSAPGLDSLVGEHAASPESDYNSGIYWLYTQTAQAVYNRIDGDTSIKIFNTEYGFGNWGTPAANTTQASFPWDAGCVPANGMYDSLQMKAVLQARSELIMPFTPYAGYNEFFFHNSDLGSTNSFQLFATYGRVKGHNSSPPFNSTGKYPNWYIRAAMYNLLGNYRPEVFLPSDTNSVWVEKWRNIIHPDSVCVVYWKASQRGSTSTGQTIPVGYIQGATMQQNLLSFSSITPSTSTVNPIGTALYGVTAYELPTFLLGIEINKYFFQPWTPPRKFSSIKTS